MGRSPLHSISRAHPKLYFVFVDGTRYGVCWKHRRISSNQQAFLELLRAYMLYILITLIVYYDKALKHAGYTDN